jgi:hypothetical protein
LARQPIKRVSKEELRSFFNRLYLSDALAGRMFEVVESEGRPNPLMNQPPGTVSQIVHLFDGQGQKVAVVHRYKLSDGSLGGSGRPDPKNVLGDDGVLYAPRLPDQSANDKPKRRKRGGSGKRRH